MGYPGLAVQWLPLSRLLGLLRGALPKSPLGKILRRVLVQQERKRQQQSGQ
jgi:acyl-CoA synthetase (AMP-forming)/AMP-acid ligase II